MRSLKSPQKAPVIHRVEGVRKLGSRLCNWLTAGEAVKRPLFDNTPTKRRSPRKRNRAILAILLGFGLRRRELADLTIDSVQKREERWAIVDLVGKGKHIHTVPVPAWEKDTLDAWLAAAEIERGPLFRCVCRADKLWVDRIFEKTVWHVVKKVAVSLKILQLLPQAASGDLARDFAATLAENLNKYSSYSVTFRYKPLSGISDTSSVLGARTRTNWELNQDECTPHRLVRSRQFGQVAKRILQI
jgi:integrase